MHTSAHTTQSVLLTSTRRHGQSTLVEDLRSPWRQVYLTFKHPGCTIALCMVELRPAKQGLLQINYQQLAFRSVSAACKRPRPQQSHATLQLDQQTEPSSSQGNEFQPSCCAHRPVLWLC